MPCGLYTSMRFLRASCRRVLRQPLRCLGLFRTPRIYCILPFVPRVVCKGQDAHCFVSRAEQEMLQLADSQLDLFTFLPVLAIAWRVRIDSVLPTTLVFHLRLIHLKAAEMTAAKPRRRLLQWLSFWWRRRPVPYTLRHRFFDKLLIASGTAFDWWSFHAYFCSCGLFTQQGATGTALVR